MAVGLVVLGAVTGDVHPRDTGLLFAPGFFCLVLMGGFLLSLPVRVECGAAGNRRVVRRRPRGCSGVTSDRRRSPKVG